VHHECGGRGCLTCGLTGTLCGPSIEELLEAPVLEHSGAQKAYLHALGREDTDARMLGRGRPFVMEVHRPVRRTLPLDAIRERFHASAAGIAEVRDLAHADRSLVAILKEAAAEKSYRAWIETPSSIPANAAEIAASLEGAVVEQLSPTRVAERRGPETRRRRRILESSWLGETGSGVAWEIRVEAGMYVKELVSGDGGRTAPSLGSALGMECACAALDVLEVHWSFPWEAADREAKALS
jgi:tRNA pseudouridine synthase 10